jgi:elongation factor Ts
LWRHSVIHANMAQSIHSVLSRRFFANSTTARCLFTPFIRTFSSSPSSSIAFIRQLRELTGAPIAECKEAVSNIQQHHANLSNDEERIQLCIEFLRKRGLNAASKKSGRKSADGLVAIAIDKNNSAIVEINSETDFCARHDKFQGLITSVATAIAGNPSSSAAISTNDFPIAEFINNNSELKSLLTDTVTSLRENIAVRRAGRLNIGQKHSGIIGSYIHNAISTTSTLKLGKSGAIVAIQAKTPANADLSANQEFSDFANKLAMHIVAAQPRYLSKSDIPQADLARESEILREQALKLAQDGPKKKESATKQDNTKIERIVQGKLNKFYEETVLLEQKSVISSGESTEKPLKIADWLEKEGKALKVNVPLEIVGFVRFAVGEGLNSAEKQSFADEVAAKIKGN